MELIDEQLSKVDSDMEACRAKIKKLEEKKQELTELKKKQALSLFEGCACFCFSTSLGFLSLFLRPYFMDRRTSSTVFPLACILA